MCYARTFNVQNTSDAEVGLCDLEGGLNVVGSVLLVEGIKVKQVGTVGVNEGEEGEAVPPRPCRRVVDCHWLR